jgi:hypothetical protein
LCCKTNTKGGEKKVRMKRREFIKDIAIGSIALTSLPTLLDTLPKIASADDEAKTAFTFVTVSDASSGTFTGDRVILTGSGNFGHGKVKGGGSFDHFTSASTLLASGNWEAEEFVSFTPGTGGFVGPLEGGQLIMKVNFFPTTGSVVPATLTQNCHAFGGFEPEGVILFVGDSEFDPAMSPPAPPSATLFHVVNKQEH